MNLNLAIGYEEPDLYFQAQRLAVRLRLPINNQSNNQLRYTKDSLVLCLHPFKALAPNFTSAYWQRRRNQGKTQGLVQACKPAKGLCIIDATAGWGKDAAILASFGAEIFMLERNPVMAVLLEDALEKRDARSKVLLNMQLLQIDAFTYLENLPQASYPDIIYLDPMHPEREKSSLVKKEMQILQQLIGYDGDPLPLLQLARKRAKKRVVLKWPQKEESILSPTRSIMGKTVRFDIYSINA